MLNDLLEFQKSGNQLYCLQPVIVKKMSDKIKEKTWYFSEWNNDPTVRNMLNMLDYIHSNFYKYNAFDNLIDENKEIITFIFIPLEKFNLTDELYIKMNSRGKKLTNFEIFKSKILEIMKDQNETELLKEFSKKLNQIGRISFLNIKKKMKRLLMKFL